MLIYLDNDPYDHLLASGISTEVLSKALQAKGHELIISADNFQEWASCWKSGRRESEEVGARLLRYAMGIQPHRILTEPSQLIKREMAALLGQNLPGPFLPPEDVANAEALFRRFIEGAATAADREALLSRWSLKEESTRRATELGELRTTPDTSSTLEEFMARHVAGCRKTTRTYIEKNFSPASSQQLKFFAKRLHKCPALRASIRADLYVNWRIATGKRMQHDRWDDLRHCINSAYVDLFVTRDAALQVAFQQIDPGPPVVTVAELAERLGIPYTGP